MKQHSRQREADALQDLQQLARRRCCTPVLWRGRIVLAFFEGAGYRQPSPRFRCSQATSARWVKRFRAQGVAGLQSRPRPPGRGPQQKLLAVSLPQTVHHSPQPAGLAQERWTLQALQALCARQTGQRRTFESIGRALKRFGYSWKRAQRTITSPDPDYQAKKGQSRNW